MAVLITGGAGYIGSHAVLFFRDRGEEVVVLDNFCTSTRGAVPTSVPLVEGSVGDIEAVSRICEQYPIDAVVHLAALISVPESVAHPDIYFETNTEQTKRLFQTLAQHGVTQGVFASTGAVYGTPSQVPVTEDVPLAPESPYGASKARAEQWLAATGSVPTEILRFFNVAGADPEHRTGNRSRDPKHITARAVRVALGLLPPLEVYGADYATPDGTGIRDYVHVWDIAEALYRSLLHVRGGETPVTMNVGLGRGYSVYEVLDTVAQVVGTTVPRTITDRRPGDARAVVADAQRIREVLEWAPSRDLATMIQHEYTWARDTFMS